ncbi:hypothetical protein O988_05181 [Pseudogymnoascus sp. VKM F-3808]|nr:hypothetical protein O988_05181 [Pseudogymnoascus sp. VKM F-3808]
MSILFYAVVASLITSQVFAVAVPDPKDLQVPTTSNAAQVPEDEPVDEARDILACGNGKLGKGVSVQKR